MNPDLIPLFITERELERLTGVEVGRSFVGGVFGGTYRPAVFRHPLRLLSFCLTQILAFVLVFTLAIPIGLVTLRGATGPITQFSMIAPFLGVTVSLALVVMVLWNLYLWLQQNRFATLLHLLDEIDRFHQVLQAVEVCDRLESVGQIHTQEDDRQQVLEALRLTRDNLIAGLRTEKVLRDHRNVLARRSDLLLHIETNLTTIRSLNLQHQASEYHQLLNDTLRIGLSVQQEVQRLYGRAGFNRD